jgi:hypothetical protein
MLGDETDGHAAWQRELAEREGKDPALVGIPLAGDLVAAATKRLGVDRFVRYVSAQLGVECGCPARQEALNRLDAKLRRWLGR